MVALALQPPSGGFDSLALRIFDVDPKSLYRISGYKTGEPYFGRGATNRFDDPGPDQEKRYGTCYLGLSLLVAFAESVLHNAMPTGGQYEVEAAAIEDRHVLRFSGPPLRLADLTGAALARLGGNGELSGTSDYSLPQQWSQAVCGHPAQVDGFLYMSRLITNGYAVVLFQRDINSPIPLAMSAHEKLSLHPERRSVMDELNVKVVG